MSFFDRRQGGPLASRGARELPEPQIAPGRVSESLRHLLKLLLRLAPLHQRADEIRAAIDPVRQELSQAFSHRELERALGRVEALELPLARPEDNGEMKNAFGRVAGAHHEIALALDAADSIIATRVLQEQITADPLAVADTLATRLCDSAGVLAEAGRWIRSMNGVLRGATGELVSLLGALADQEPVVQARLEAVRTRLTDAKDLDELERLRRALLSETAALIQQVVEQRDRLGEAHGQIVETQEQIATLERALGDATKMAMTDPLTGLGNRRALDVDVRDHAASESDTGVVVVDVDHFKQVNDKLGHAAGDLVLRKLAAMLREELRGDDRAYRVGGEELVVLLARVSPQGAIATAERLRQRIARAPVRIGMQMVPVTVSMGVTLWTSGEGFDTAQERADQALYAAKSGGRNRVVSG